MSAKASLHYIVAFEENEDGWWVPHCNCGFKLSAHPTAEDAADALMWHAYERGYADASKASFQDDAPASRQDG